MEIREKAEIFVEKDGDCVFDYSKSLFTGKMMNSTTTKPTGEFSDFLKSTSMD
jgi:hypothetical protein